MRCNVEEVKNRFSMIRNLKELLFDGGIFGFFLIFVLTFTNKNSIINLILLFLILLLFFITKSITAQLITNVTTILMMIGVLSYNNSSIEIIQSEVSFISHIIVIYILMFFCLIQAFFIIYRIYTYEIGVVASVSRKRPIFSIVLRLINGLEVFLHKISLIIPMFYYIFLTALIIILYANIFSSMNNFYDLHNSKNGFYTNVDRIKFDGGLDEYIYKASSSDGVEESTIRIPILRDYFHYETTTNSKQKQVNSDFLFQDLRDTFLVTFLSEYTYFSATTFYTVGYGDIEIRGAIPKLIVQSEMFLASIFNIIFIPLMLFVIQDYVTRKREKNRSIQTASNKYSHYKNENRLVKARKITKRDKALKTLHRSKVLKSRGYL